MSEGAVCAFWLVMLNLRLRCADDFLSAKMMVLSLHACQRGYLLVGGIRGREVRGQGLALGPAPFGEQRVR